MRTLLCGAALITSCLMGCRQERTVTVSGGLIGLPGATHNFGPDVRTKGRKGTSLEGALASHAPLAGETLTEVESEPLRLVDEDGVVTLVSRSPRHVLFHLVRTLDTGEHDLLFEQVLSEETKREYRGRALDPWEAVEFVLEHESAIRDFVRTMPMGEQTPGLLLRSLGPNRFRLNAPTMMGPELRFRHADFVVENGSFRLLVIR